MGVSSVFTAVFLWFAGFHPKMRKGHRFSCWLGLSRWAMSESKSRSAWRPNILAVSIEKMVGRVARVSDEDQWGSWGHPRRSALPHKPSRASAVICHRLLLPGACSVLDFYGWFSAAGKSSFATFSDSQKLFLHSLRFSTVEHASLAAAFWSQQEQVGPILVFRRLRLQVVFLRRRAPRISLIFVHLW